MKTLSIPANEATQRLEQAFQLVFDTAAQEYAQLCNRFSSLGGLPRAWIVKGESGTGGPFASYSKYLAMNMFMYVQHVAEGIVLIGALVNLTAHRQDILG